MHSLAATSQHHQIFIWVREKVICVRVRSMKWFIWVFYKVVPSISLFSRSDMKFQVQTLASLKKRYYESIFAHAEFDNEVIEVVLLGELQQILPRLLPQTQVHRVGVEPHLHYISLLLRLDVTR